jgi:hypothetical protein
MNEKITRDRKIIKGIQQEDVRYFMANQLNLMFYIRNKYELFGQPSVKSIFYVKIELLFIDNNIPIRFS